MHECYAMQILEIKEKKKWSQRIERRNTKTMSKRLNQIEHFASKTFQMQLSHWSYYSYQNVEQLQDWNKGLKPLSTH